MPKYLGKQRIGYCQRSGFKVPYDELVQDSEVRGLLVREGEDDSVHPQRYLPEVAPQQRPPRKGMVTSEDPPTPNLEQLWFD